MQFAIVDIETTGGHASASCITEISIFVHDGEKVVGRFDSLINPGCNIPYYITGLTGITNAMVKDAPPFEEVAEEVYNILNGKVFVAHSVNFDYSFVNHQLLEHGYDLKSKKACTVRLSRKIFPGLPSYSLGNLCNSLKIPITDRHRAAGDAAATVKLFEMLLENDTKGLLTNFLKRNSKEQVLPPNLPKEQFEKLPSTPGVYYFHDQKGKVVYVGKAIDLKKRVSSHFTNNSTGKQKQEFLRSIYNVTFTECGNELMSLLLESHEIKRLWPLFNRSQKRFEAAFGIVDYHDQKGFKRLALTQLKKDTTHIISFNNLMEGSGLLYKLIEQHDLCPRLAGYNTGMADCTKAGCVCKTTKRATITAYNSKVDKAIETLRPNESFVILEKGRQDDEHACVVVEKGTFKGMGYIPPIDITGTIDADIVKDITAYKENFNIRQIISRYVTFNPKNVFELEV